MFFSFYDVSSEWMVNMNNTICKYCIYLPTTYVRSEKVFAYLNEVKRSFILNEKEFCEYQEIKFKELVYYLERETVYYKKKFEDNGIQIHEINHLDDIKKFDIIDKNEIKANYHAMDNKNAKKYWRSTSGTTGNPFKFQKDTYASGYMDAVMYTAYSWYNIDIGDRQARIWGTAVEPTIRIVQIGIDYFMNRKRLSTFKMTSESCGRFEQCIHDFKAQYIYGYVNGVYEFVETLKRLGIKWKTKLKCVIVTGEVLFDYQRMALEDYFETFVVNEYGTTENGVIGFECKNKKMHIMPNIYLEAINKDENGYGTLLVTELTSRSLPFIRYKLGDVGRIIRGYCNCGSCLPVLELKEGRLDSYIVLPNGKVVYDAILAYVLKAYAVSFRGRQKSLGKLTIEIVPKEKFTKSKQNNAEQKLRKYLGKDIDIVFIVKNEIEKEKSGKLRYFIPIDK